MLLSGAHASDNEFGEITIRVIDEVGVPEKEWRVAEQSVDKLFQAARVSVIWVRCVWNPNTSECPQATSPNEVNLILVSEESARRLQAPPKVFGMALTPPDGPFGSRGYIYYGRIQTKCGERHDINEAFLLGAVVAHEIGHLLLGPNSHSTRGIMKPDLERADMTGINLSVLEFNKRQCETLRTAAARRLQAAHSQDMNASLYVAQATER